MLFTLTTASSGWTSQLEVDSSVCQWYRDQHTVFLFKFHFQRQWKYLRKIKCLACFWSSSESLSTIAAIWPEFLISGITFLKTLKICPNGKTKLNRFPFCLSPGSPKELIYLVAVAGSKATPVSLQEQSSETSMLRRLELDKPGNFKNSLSGTLIEQPPADRRYLLHFGFIVQKNVLSFLKI